eukprot:TRINITY_DN752_c1_g2_i1.p1 TRINITY_DN752_c1_g2~~TRINITY_DN752_c1_g2_i1.p1  ORF type:complete len:608 (-),score=149.30 TRINITY_DN752_c1_g2_i1:1647-3206(-)
MDGCVFERNALVEWLRAYKIHPCTGKPLSLKDVFPIHFHKNAEGEIHCPTTFKVFTRNSHIVVIRRTGNVFSYDAVLEMNIRLKNYKDLLDDTPFKKSDIITIQDPNDPARLDMSAFYYVKSGMQDAVGKVSESKGESKDPRLKDIGLGRTMERMMAAIDAESTNESTNEILGTPQVGSDMSASFTSSALEIVDHRKKSGKEFEKKKELKIFARMREFARGKDRRETLGFVRIITTEGPLNIELECAQCPQTSYNFIELCKKGYYDGTIFHRSIPGFMIQGGDPTGTGRGGESIWKTPFADEIRGKLKHSDRGILSMANSGTNTNGSQFFILYDAASHLDGKHTVFGRVVGGLGTLDAMEKIRTNGEDRPLAASHLDGKHTVFGRVVGGLGTLDAMEKIRTNGEDRPLKEIKILDTEVFFDAFDAVRNEEGKHHLSGGKHGREEVDGEEEEEEEAKRGQWYSNPRGHVAVGEKRGEDPSSEKRGSLAMSIPTASSSSSSQIAHSRKVKKQGSGFDFSGW